MVRIMKIVALLGSALLWASPARAAEPIQLTYDQALARGREAAPSLEVARARIAEAEGALAAAEVLRLNPQVLANVGPRFGTDGTGIDASVRATQWLEAGGQRGHRVDAARAEVEASEARSEDAQRLLLREIAMSFVAALYWQRRVEIAGTQLELAAAAEEVARRRHELGDVGGLEESSAALAHAHAQVELEQARAALVEVEGRLAALLGVEPGAQLHALGDLRDQAMRPPASVAAAPAPLEQRPDFRALEAEARGARAMGALGRSLRAPNLAIGAGYAHEESDHVVFGIVGLTLPVFSRGQGERARAEAQEARVETELDARLKVAAVEASTANTLVERNTAAAEAFEREGLAQLERTAELTTVGYEKGAVAYDAVLVVRLELTRARIHYTELLLAAASARVELAASTGALQ